MIYFTSDHHFNNSLIYEYRKSTPSSENLFNNIGEMNRLMVKNVNEILKDGDILYILGDFGDFEYLSQFNPKVKYMIILGNHDDIADDEGEIPLKTLKKVIDYNDLNVEIITCANKDVILDKRYSALKKKYESIEILPILGGLFLLSHIPINNSKLLKYSINIHGHLHPGKFHGFTLKDDVNSRTYEDEERHWNVTVDYNDFKPISLKSIYEKLGLLPID